MTWSNLTHFHPYAQQTLYRTISVSYCTDTRYTILYHTKPCIDTVIGWYWYKIRYRDSKSCKWPLPLVDKGFNAACCKHYMSHILVLTSALFSPLFLSFISINLADLCSWKPSSVVLYSFGIRAKESCSIHPFFSLIFLCSPFNQLSYHCGIRKWVQFYDQSS